MPSASGDPDIEETGIMPGSGCGFLEIIQNSDCTSGFDDTVKPTLYAGLAAIAFLLLIVLLLSIAVCCLCVRLRKEKRKSRSDPEQGSEEKGAEQEEDGAVERESSSNMQMSALKSSSENKEEVPKEDKVVKTAVVTVDTDDIMYDTVQGPAAQVASTSNAPLPDYDSIDDIMKKPTQAPFKDNNPPTAPPPPPLSKSAAKFEQPEYSVVAKKTKPATAKASETGTYNVLIHDTTPEEVPSSIDQTPGSVTLVAYSSISRERSVEGSKKSPSARNSGNHDPEDDFSPPLPPPISEDDLPSSFVAPKKDSNTKTVNAMESLYGNTNGIKVDTSTKISSKLSGSDPNLLTQQDESPDNQIKKRTYTESSVNAIEESLYMNC